MMRIVNWHICVEAPLTTISEFKLCVGLYCDLQLYLPIGYQIGCLPSQSFLYDRGFESRRDSLYRQLDVFLKLFLF